MIRQCCECKRIWISGQWIKPLPRQLDHEDVSHGYCEECFVKQMQIIRSLKKVAAAVRAKKVLNPFFF